MNETILKLVFSTVKDHLSLDFAIPGHMQIYGSNSAEVKTGLAVRFGPNAHGIWLRHWDTVEFEETADPNICYVVPFNLSPAQMKDVMVSFNSLGYYTAPCTGNFNTNGFFSIEEIPVTKRLQRFFIDTPLGVMDVHAKPHDSSYPGVYVDLLEAGDVSTDLACVEYVPDDCDIAVDVYTDAQYNATYCERFTIENIRSKELVIAKQHIQRFLGDDVTDATFRNLRRVPLAWTSIETDYEGDQLYIQAYADLINPAMVYCIGSFEDMRDAVTVYRCEYDSLYDLNNEELDILDFDTLIYISEEEWETFRKSENGMKWLSENYPAGSRIWLTGDLYDPILIRAYTYGTVLEMTADGKLLVAWDNRERSFVRFGVDHFKKVFPGHIES